MPRRGGYRTRSLRTEGGLFSEIVELKKCTTKKRLASAHSVGVGVCFLVSALQQFGRFSTEVSPERKYANFSSSGGLFLCTYVVGSFERKGVSLASVRAGGGGRGDKFSVCFLPVYVEINAFEGV